jgi:hypothetical protein
VKQAKKLPSPQLEHTEERKTVIKFVAEKGVEIEGLGDVQLVSPF